MYDLDVENIRFSEEILSTKPFEDKDRYAVNFPDKVCTNTHGESDYFVGQTPVCHYCYYRELVEAMRDKGDSQKQEFLIYQMDARKLPVRFLKEFHRFVGNNRKYLDQLEVGLAAGYLRVIEDIRANLKKPLKEKAEAVLHHLAEIRYESVSVWDWELRHEFNGLLFGNDLTEVVELLKGEHKIAVVQSKDGDLVTITPTGITHVDGLSNGTKSTDSSRADRLEELFFRLDTRLTDLSVLVAQGDAELAQLIDDLHEEFTEFSKPSLKKVVKGKVGELILTEVAKTYGMHPLLREATDLISHLGD